MHFLELTYSRDATVPVPCFCCFCVSEKLHGKYSRNWMKQKLKFLFFPSVTESKAETEGSQRAAAPPHGAGHPWPHQGLVWAPGPPPDAALPPIYSPRRENLKSPINFHETYCKPPPSSTRDREGLEALPNTQPERGITVRDLLHHHAYLRSDV
jgi:hypothetical protein